MNNFLREKWQKYRQYFFAPAFVFVAAGLLVGVSVRSAVEKPDQKLWRALSKLDDASSWIYEGSFTHHGKVSTRYSDLLAGNFGTKNPTTYKDFGFNFKGGRQILTSQESQSYFSFETKSSDKKEVAIGLETKYVGRNFYMALTKASNVPSELAAYKNTWIQFSVGSLLGQLGIDTALLDKINEKRAVDEADRVEEEKQVKALVAKSRAFLVSSPYTVRSNGVGYDVYNFSINKNNFKKLVADLNVLAEHTVTQTRINNLNKELSTIRSMSGRVWVSRNDGMPYRFSLSALGTDYKEKTSMEIVFKSFNKPVTVSEPANYMDWQELLDKIFPNAESTTHLESNV